MAVRQPKITYKSIFYMYLKKLIILFTVKYTVNMFEMLRDDIKFSEVIIQKVR